MHKDDNHSPSKANAYTERPSDLEKSADVEMLKDDELLRYSRHIMLKEFDLEGQLRLKSAHIAVAGCGGLGMAALPLLVGAGVGKITLIDFDTVDLSNLHRQTAYKMADLDKPKAEQAKALLSALNPEVQIDAINQKVGFSELLDIAQKVDCFLDCSDNFELRTALNRACIEAKIPLISGSAVRFEGQLTVYDFRDASSACYECLFAGDRADDGNCALFGVFSPVVHIIGVTQAQEALKFLLGIGRLTTGNIRLYNALDNEWQSFRYQRNPNCSAHH